MYVGMHVYMYLCTNVCMYVQFVFPCGKWYSRMEINYDIPPRRTILFGE